MRKNKISVKTSLISPAVTSFNEGGEISPTAIIRYPVKLEMNGVAVMMSRDGKQSGYNCIQRTLKPQL